MFWLFAEAFPVFWRRDNCHVVHNSMQCLWVWCSAVVAAYTYMHTLVNGQPRLLGAWNGKWCPPSASVGLTKRYISASKFLTQWCMITHYNEIYYSAIHTTNFLAFFYEISEETRGLVCICNAGVHHYQQLLLQLFIPLNSVSLRLHVLCQQFCSNGAERSKSRSSYRLRQSCNLRQCFLECYRQWSLHHMIPPRQPRRSKQVGKCEDDNDTSVLVIVCHVYRAIAYA